MRTIRTHLLVLTMVAAVPPILFAAFVLERLAGSETRAFGRDMIEVARALSLNIDGRVAEETSALQVLADSPSLRSGDLDVFRREVATAARLLHTDLVLSGPDGRELVNTFAPPGTELPYRNGKPFADIAIRTRKPVVSNLYRGAAGARWIVSVEVPVIVDGEARYVLAATMDTTALSGLLAGQHLPEGWICAIIDGHGLFIARSRDEAARLAQPASETFRGTISSAPEGWTPTVSVEGFHNYLGYSRSELTGWSVGVSVPRELVQAPLRQALIPLACAGIVLAGASLLIAMLIARRIQRPIAAIERLARSAAATTPESVPDLGLREANEVARALVATRAEERAAADSLKTSEARYRALADEQPSLMFITGADGACTYTNRIFQDYCGLSAEDLTGDSWLAVIHPDDRERTAAEWSRSVRDVAPYEIEYRFRASDGSYRWLLGRGAAALDEGGRVTAWFGTATDINDLVVSREQLAQRGGALEAEVAARTAERDRTWMLSRELLAVIGPDGRFISVNPAFSATLGHPEPMLVGAPFLDFVHPEDQERTREEYARVGYDGATDRFENRYRCADGGYRILSWTTRSQEGITYAAARDVTEERATQAALRQAEEQARQTQKLEAVGQLTGGIAHDFNNLLQVVSANLELLGTAMGPVGSAAERRHSAASIAVRRGTALTRQLLAFARKQPLDPRAIDAGRLLRQQGELLRRTLGETIAIEVLVPTGLWTVFADPNQLENAILNLAVNARDAIISAGRSDGRLTLEAGNASLDARFAAQAEVEPGQYVCIAVSDTGPGMSREVMARAFEPFFTTKPDGEGTGLGLAQVYGFTRQSGGYARIYSEPGLGTTVRLYLARSTTAAVDEAAGGSEAEAEGGTETVLVVEDDAAVRTAAVGMLESLGYRTLTACDAASALAVIEDGARIDLLFTDVVMPGPMTSVELARRTRELQTGAAVLFTSGYTANAIVHHGRLDPGVSLLSKPYARNELARKVRSVLGPPRAPASGHQPAPPGGGAGRTILLVEDDELIRLSTAMMLESLGHAVVEAGTGAQALAMLANEPGIDLLVTDLGLPDVNGADLVARALHARPGLPAIVASGRGVGEVPGAVPLPKPYTLEQLRAALAQVEASDPLSIRS